MGLPRFNSGAAVAPFTRNGAVVHFSLGGCMRSTFQKVAAAVSSYLTASGSAEKSYALTMAPVLAEVWKKSDGKVSEVRKEWRSLNVAAYKVNKLRKGNPVYGRLAKLNSYLLTLSVKSPKRFDSLCNGEYVSLQTAARKGGKTAKRVTVRTKTERFLNSLSASQRAWVVRNIRSVAATL